MSMCFIGMVIGWNLKEAGIVNASIASASLVTMAYIGGKTLNNQEQIKNKQNEKE
ncbi:MAG: hypothetical protein HQ522_16165 [Bacteroidetes bacterium]|nr:hypothetical protein [Bacteroidota bacterium]